MSLMFGREHYLEEVGIDLRHQKVHFSQVICYWVGERKQMLNHVKLEFNRKHLYKHSSLRVLLASRVFGPNIQSYEAGIYP